MRRNRFSHFLAIDWSGAVGERHEGIALAMCSCGSDAPELIRPGHRWSRAEVRDFLRHGLPPDTLVGLDLVPGLPFIDRGAYFPGWDRSPTDGPALWKLVDELAHDPHLAANSFLAVPEVWRHFRHGQGLCGDLFEPGRGRLRQTEIHQRLMQLSPSSCFNLVGAAQVGKASLTGMRVLHQLEGAVPVWPFDPLPETGSVIVEIYTSLAARETQVPPGRSKLNDGYALDMALERLGSGPHRALPHYTDHATDAILACAWLRAAATRHELWKPAALPPEIAFTEGWTFGVT